MSDLNETPIHAFQRLYREEWARFLETPMGQGLQAAVYFNRPAAFTSDTPHKDSFTLGKVFQHEQTLTLLLHTLKSPVQTVETAPQPSYPKQPDDKGEEDEEDE